MAKGERNRDKDKPRRSPEPVTEDLPDESDVTRHGQRHPGRGSDTERGDQERSREERERERPGKQGTEREREGGSRQDR
jgi:hypothetical protein